MGGVILGDLRKQSNIDYWPVSARPILKQPAHVRWDSGSRYRHVLPRSITEAMNWLANGDNKCSRLKLHESEFTPADLEAIGPPRYEYHHGGWIGLFLLAMFLLIAHFAWHLF